jgi:endonuclease III related protein
MCVSSRDRGGADSEFRRLRSIYETLHRAAGPRSWWPGRSRFEIILGAILTQNTSWKNVETVLAGLRRDGLLRVTALRALTEEELAGRIRSSGYYRQKARKLRAFLDFLDREYGGSLRRAACASTDTLRRQLLDVWGIGPETADSILLYAFERAVFVVDLYTTRVLSRHGLIPVHARYDDVQRYLSSHMPQDVPLFNDFHAQFVWVGQRFCGTQPHCDRCPLRPLLPERGPLRLQALGRL